MEMESFYNYLPTLITVVIIAPFGFYFKIKMKNLATKHDFDIALKQLEKSTKAVEDIKIQLSEKFWVKQQIWDTKRESYDELIDCFYHTKNYLVFLNEFTSDYKNAFHSNESPGERVEYDEEYCKAYASYREGEKLEFNQKYNSERALKHRSTIENDIKDRLRILETTLQKKSIYLSIELSEIRNSINDIYIRAFEQNLMKEEGEDVDDFLERQIEHYNKSSELLGNIIKKLKVIATKDLKLEY
ncbi:hypothetical protein [Colwellia sp. 20A7]|uniref:hypothetical protein n=1 Tax=Colwellia sp. 20A7 TaxID=2689569 RepID=UPI0013584DDB|nr:hypothetical protein [Colwellia sp. 20A7]